MLVQGLTLSPRASQLRRALGVKDFAKLENIIAKSVVRTQRSPESIAEDVLIAVDDWESDADPTGINAFLGRRDW